jgi:diguanylate cyclase (GGDEF)-like protein/PAS domain S-box-containing protein
MSDFSFSTSDDNTMLRLFRSVVDNAMDAVLITTPQFDSPGLQVIYVNPAFTHLTGYESAEIVGKTPSVLQGPLTDQRVMNRLRDDLTNGRTFAGTTTHYRKDGSPYVLEWTSYPLLDDQGTPLCFVAIQRDGTHRTQYERIIAEKNRLLEEANVHLEMQALTDGLTGLHNFRSFQAKIAEEFERSRRYKLPLSVVMLDVDHFKGFNDSFGHPAGDSVLQDVGRLMLETSRAVDFAARYGGEEFIMILPNTDANGALIFAERLRGNIENAAWPQRPITVSVGIASRDEQTQTPLELIQRADAALYKSKERGRNRVTVSQ